MGAHTVSTANPSQSSRVLNTLTAAFIADPFFRWAFPEIDNYLDGFPKLLTAYCGGGIEDGSAHATPSFSGAAIWLAPGKTPNEEATGAALEQTLRLEKADDFFGVMGELDKYHPHDEPLWYLPAIGVDPAYQRQGIGAALLKHALSLCDAQGTRAYLESSNPANISLYERHGFVVMGRIEVGSAPPIHPMIREKR